MTDTLRYRHGDTKPVMMPVDSSTAIDIGDLIYLNNDDALPASSQTDQGSETANQRLFASKFLGVAEQRSRDGDDQPIRIATSGVFEFEMHGRHVYRRRSCWRGRSIRRYLARRSNRRRCQSRRPCHWQSSQG